jgi:phenylpropionate dioxygenase-like ring-hydroxylating dioxygenase large terminal subunit
MPRDPARESGGKLRHTVRAAAAGNEAGFFPLLRRQWTPAIPLVELQENPLKIRVAGESLAVFRDGRGGWHALVDRCPHRGAALSLGTVTSEGELQCRYHGWRFRGDGTCSRVPLNKVNPAALAKINAAAVPVAIIAGALWIYTGLLRDGTPPLPTLPESLQGPAQEYGIYSQDWTAHWTRAVENFIDFAHPSYLHRHTIGAWTHDYAEAGGMARVEVVEHDWGLETLNYFDSRRQGFRVDWYRPNLSVLHFGASAATRLHVFSVPVDAERTRVMTVRRMPPGMDPAAVAERLARVDHTILDEDRVVVESQVGPVDDDHEMSVATDAPAVAFRRWYRQMMRSARGTPGA